MADGVLRRRSQDLLPAVLALGRLPFDAAAEPLLGVLAIDAEPTIRAAAAWSLGRWGERALEALIPLAERGEGETRFWAALSALRGLLDEPEMALTAAQALANAHDARSAPLIYRLYRDAPDEAQVIMGYESFLQQCFSEEPEPPIWYVEWRRQPPDWLPRMRFQYPIAPMGRPKPADPLELGCDWPRKPLKQLALSGRRAGRATGRWRFRCSGCGFMTVRIFGVEQCPETAFPDCLLLQGTLRRIGNRGTLAQTLDALDGLAWKSWELWLGGSDKPRMAWYRTHYALQEMLVGGLRSVPEAVAAVRATRASLGELFGLPLTTLTSAPSLETESKLASGQDAGDLPEVSLPREGRRCLCGSGRPLGECCHRLN